MAIFCEEPVTRYLGHRASGARQGAVLTAQPRRCAHKRHTRKYAEGNLDEARSFFFCGPDKSLNLRVHNLVIFTQLTRRRQCDVGVSPHAHDYSEWFRERIRDEKIDDGERSVEDDKGVLGTSSISSVASILVQHQNRDQTVYQKKRFRHPNRCGGALELARRQAAGN